MSKKIHSKLTPYSKPYSPEKLDFLEEQIHISDHVISDLLRNAPCTHKVIDRQIRGKNKAVCALWNRVVE